MTKVLTITKWSLLLACVSLVGGHGAYGAELDVAMDRKMVSVLIRVGLDDTGEGTWEGTYHATKGRIVATAGWRFTGNDYATLEKFRVANRLFYPRFFKRNPRSLKTLTIEPNGFILTLTDVAASSVEAASGRPSTRRGRLRRKRSSLRRKTALLRWTV